MQEFSELLSDNRSGSVAIVSSFLRFLESSPENIEEKIELMKKAFPDMILVRSICDIIKSQYGKREFNLSAIKERFFDSQNMLIAKAVSVLKKYDSFATISSSGDIYNTLKRIAQQKKLKVVLSIGEPAKEGVLQAKKLAASGIRVSLVPDAALAGFVKDTDAIILGADGVGDSCFINKIGSFPLLLAAEYYKKPAYIIANRLKYSDNLSVSSADSQEPGKNSENICSKNFYFEKIPLMAKWIHQ